MPDYIEILLTARDLASGKIGRAADKMEADLAKTKVEAAATGAAFDQMSHHIDAAVPHLQGAERAVDQLARKLPQATTKVGDFAQRVQRDLSKAGQQLDIDFDKVSHVTEQLTLNLDKVGVAFTETGQRARGLQGRVREAENAFRLLRSEVRRLDPDMGRMRSTMRTLEIGAAGAARAVGRDLVRGLRALTPHLRITVTDSNRAARAMQDLRGVMTALGPVAAAAAGDLTRLAGAFKILGIVGLVTFGVQGLSGAVVALSGSTMSLVGALSTLSASFVALPAAIGAAAGSMIGFMTVLRPATTGIMQYIQAQSKATGVGGGGGGGGGAPSGDAAAAAGQARQVRDAERALQQARLSAVQSVKDAERSLADARRNAVRDLIDLERQLHDLKMQNSARERQLEAAVQDARAVAAAEAARGGGEGGIGLPLARAAVGEAAAQLGQFRRGARAEERNVLTQGRRTLADDTRQVQRAEESLAQARLDAARQIADAQRRLVEQRRQANQAQTAGNAGLSQEAALYADLSPLQKRVADNIIAIKNQWNDMGVIVRARNSFLKEILADLRAVRRNLPVLARDASRFANVITEGIGGARRIFTRPGGGLTALGQRSLGGGGGLGARGGFAGFTARQERQLVGVGPGAGGGVLAGVEALTRLTTSAPAREFLHWMSEVINGFGKAALASERLSESSGRLDTFFRHGRSVMTLLGRAFRDTFIALKNLGSFSFPQGEGLLKSLADAARHFRHFTENARNAGRIRRFFREADEVTRSMAHAVGVLFRALKRLGDDAIKGGKNSPVAQFFDALAAIIPDLADAIRNINRNTGPAFLQLLRDLGPALKNLSVGTSSIGYLVDLLDLMVQGVTALTGDKGIGKLTGQMLVLGFVFRGVIGQLVKFIALAIIGTVTETGWTAATTAAAAATTILEFALLALPWVAVAAAAIAAIILIYKNWDKITEFFSGLWDKVKTIFTDAWDALVGFIKDHWQDILVFLTGPLGIAALIYKYRHDLWGKVKEIFSAAWETLVRIVKSAWNGLVGFFGGGGWRSIKSALDTIWTKLKNLAKEAWSGIVSFFTGAGKDALLAAFKAIFNGIAPMLVDAGNLIIGIFEGLINKIIHALNWVITKIGLSKIGDVNLPRIPEVGGGGHRGGAASSNTPVSGVPGGGGYFPMGDLPHFEEGGVVPGPEGAPQLIVAHGGEVVLPRIGGAPPPPGTAPHGGTGGGILSPFFDLLPDIPDLSGKFGTVGHVLGGALDWMKDKAIHWARDKITSVIAAPIRFVGGLLGKGGGSDTTSGVNQSLGRRMMLTGGHSGRVSWPHWAATEWPSLQALWSGESGWNERIGNTSSGAYGIPQALPASKMASAGANYMTSAATQIAWGLAYIASRYGSPSAAFQQWSARSPHWYAMGGPISGGSEGQPVGIMAHVGEWVLNRKQQARVASYLGGMSRARSVLFDRQPERGYSFAGGGVIRRGARSVVTGGGVEQHFTIHTTSPNVDIDYVARIAEARMAHLA